MNTYSQSPEKRSSYLSHHPRTVILKNNSQIMTSYEVPPVLPLTVVQQKPVYVMS